MFPSTALFSFVVAALSLGASAKPIAREAPKFNLAFATRVNATGFSSIVAADQARAKHLKTKGSKRDASVSVTNTAVSALLLQFVFTTVTDEQNFFHSYR